MEVARLRAEVLGNCGGERHHVMLDLGFDRGDPLHVEASLCAHGARRLGGNVATSGEHFGGDELDFEPLSELVFFGPDSAHLRARVASDHDGFLKTKMLSKPEGFKTKKPRSARSAS